MSIRGVTEEAAKELQFWKDMGELYKKDGKDYKVWAFYWSEGGNAMSTGPFGTVDSAIDTLIKKVKPYKGPNIRVEIQHADTVLEAKRISLMRPFYAGAKLGEFEVE